MAFSLEDLPLAWRNANSVNSHTRGAGWWRWKPYYLLRELRQLGEGEVLVHADYDLILNKKPSALFCLGQQVAKGVGAFHMPCLSEASWTKREVATALNASEDVMQTVQIYAGLLVLRRTRFAEAFLERWLEVSILFNSFSAIAAHLSICDYAPLACLSTPLHMRPFV